MGSQSAPPSARVHWPTSLWRAFFAEGEAPWVTWVCTLTGRVTSSHVTSCRRCDCLLSRAHPLAHMNCVVAANRFLVFEVAGQSLLKTVHDPLLEIPSRPRIRLTGTFRWRSWEFSHLCTPALVVVSVNKQSLDIAGVVNDGKDDPDVGAGDQGVRLGYTRGGTGKTVARILMVGLEGAGKITIFFKLKLGDMVTTSQRSVPTWRPWSTRTNRVTNLEPRPYH